MRRTATTVRNDACSMFKEDLKRLIGEAFKEAPQPAVTEITSHECWECNKVREDFGKHLDGQLPEDLLDYHKDSLSFFTASALRYFLPRYLLHSIEHPDSEFTDYTIYHLSPSDLEVPYWRERLSVFSEDEKKAICRYLGYLETQEGCELSLDDIKAAKRIWCNDG